MKEHELKILPEFFQAIEAGHKTFEVRYDDRDYQMGDVLCLSEWDCWKQAYTGRKINCRITYILSACSGIGLQSGYVCMGFELCPVKALNNPDNEALSRISKEAKLLSDCAWLATTATDLEAGQNALERTINQWGNLQHVMAELLPAVQS